MLWNPERYNQFQKERSAPFEDLFQLIHVREKMQVIDLGCGTGQLTEQLAERLPASQVLGIDSSTEMLARAQELTKPNLHFERTGIESVQGKWDLVFSNAAIQWVPDHPQLIARLFALVRPGGQIVIQLPSNHNHIVHQLILETAQEQPYQQALSGWVRQVPVLSIEAYAELLFAQGGQDLVVFEKVYPHVLQDADAIADWTSGTALLPYMERLEPDMRSAFMLRYRQRLRALWPSGPVFYGFRRILFAATHP